MATYHSGSHRAPDGPQRAFTPPVPHPSTEHTVQLPAVPPERYFGGGGWVFALVGAVVAVGAAIILVVLW